MTLHLRVRRQGRTARLCGIDVESIEQSTTVSRVPGSPFGMALVRSQIIPVLRLGEANSCLVVGRVRGEVFGLVGVEVLGLEREEGLISADPSSPSNAHPDDVLARSRATSSRSEIVEGELDVEVLVADAKSHQGHRPQSSEERS